MPYNVRYVGRVIGAIVLVGAVAVAAIAQSEQQAPSDTPAQPVAPAQTSALSPAERDAVVKLENAKPAVRRDGAAELGKLRSRGAAGDLAKAAASDTDPS